MPTTKTAAVEVPALDIDKILYPTTGRAHPNGVLERRIVANLIAHLERAGWHVNSVWDSEDDTKVKTMKEAMELVFNLDESRVYFKKGRNEHSVVLIGGNGCDMVSDWTFIHGDADGFKAAMDDFDPEQFA